jgi:hypothetical protein
LSAIAVADTCTLWSGLAFALVDEGVSGEIENQVAILFRIEGEVEVIKSPVGIAKAGLFAVTFQQPVGTASQFLQDPGDERINLTLTER